MDYFFWHNVDKYLKEKFGEKVYNRMWAYVFIAIYVVYFVCIISDVMSFYVIIFHFNFYINCIFCYIIYFRILLCR